MRRSRVGNVCPASFCSRMWSSLMACWEASRLPFPPEGSRTLTECSSTCQFRHSSLCTENTTENLSFNPGKFGRLGHGMERNQLVPKMVEVSERKGVCSGRC